jgi:bifunctional non-homologous end joining protein LigD
MVFDLDPGEVEFGVVCDLGLAVKDVLDRLGLESCAKTSGSRGLHVYVPLQPIYTYDQVAPLADRIARIVVQENPRVATLERSKQTRPERAVYVDHLQNARGKTVASPYSVRAQPGAMVSAPLTWREVRSHASPQDFTLKTMPKRLSRRGDLFEPVLSKKQKLERVLARLGQVGG